MENISHTRYPNRSSSAKMINNGGFLAKTLYDDVYGGPPKFGLSSLSPRLEDYSEIFGCFHASRASSIPVLDIPAVDETEVFFDVRSSGFDYREVFGGFNGLDFIVAYDDLVNQSKGADGDGGSSDEAWTPAESGSLSEGSDDSGKNKFSAKRHPYQSFDGNTELSISYHTAHQKRNKGPLSGMAHVTEAHVVPGCTFLLDEITTLQQADDENPVFQVVDDSKLNVIPNVEAVTEKHLKKIMSHALNDSSSGQSFGENLKHERGYVRYGSQTSHHKKPFVTVSDISLRTQPSHLPPPTRPPPIVDGSSGDSGRLSSNSNTVVSDGTSSPPFFDVEVDASSSATASAAAMKDAMERAKIQLRSAKELMQRRKEGFQSSSKSVSKIEIKEKDGNVGKILVGSNIMKDDRVRGTSEREDSGMKFSVTKERQKVLKTAGELPGPVKDETLVNVAKIFAREMHGKGSLSSQGSFRIDKASEWQEATQYFELVALDESRKAFGQANKEKSLVLNRKSHEHRQKEQESIEALMQQEEHDEKVRAVLEDELEKQACGWEECNARPEAAKEVPRRKEHEKKVKVTREIHEERQNEMSPSMGKLPAESEKKRDRSERSEKHDIVVEVQDKENKFIVEQARKLKAKDKRIKSDRRLEESRGKEDIEKKQEEALEQQENERRFKEAFKQEENEKRLKKVLEQEENEKRLKEALEQVENEKRLKEALELQETEKKLKEAFERENKKKQKEATLRKENEKRLKEAVEKEEHEKRQKVAFEWEQKKKQKEATQREENEKRLKEALERKEYEKRQKEAFEWENKKKQKEAIQREENEKRLKEVLEREEYEKRKKEAFEWKNKKKQKGAIQREENEKQLKEALERKEYEKRQNNAQESEESEQRLKMARAWEEQYDQEGLMEVQDKEGSEVTLKKIFMEVEIQNMLASESEPTGKTVKVAGELDELKVLNQANEGINGIEIDQELRSVTLLHMGREDVRVSDQTCNQDCDNNSQATQIASNRDEHSHSIETTQEAPAHEENGETSTAHKCGDTQSEVVEQVGVAVDSKVKASGVSPEDTENGENRFRREDANESLPLDDSLKKAREEIRGEPKASRREFGAFEMENVPVDGKLKPSGMAQKGIEHGFSQVRVEDACGSISLDNHVKKAGEAGSGCEQPQVEQFKSTSAMDFDHETKKMEFAQELKEAEKDLKQVQASLIQEENKKAKSTPELVKEFVENKRKIEAALPAMAEVNSQKSSLQGNASQAPRRKEKNFKDTLKNGETERSARERELENDRLRKLKEEREREREREKDRMAVDRATLEAREWAYGEARERAERAAVERATAEARQRAMAEARERLEKACAEAREKSLAGKAAMEARVKAERAAVERATAEARERAAEKLMAERAAFEARERVQRSVSDKFSVSSRSNGLRHCSSSSDLQGHLQSTSASRYQYSSVLDERYEGGEGESAQRCKARLERHARTAERAARALQEKNMRDLLAQREQTERNRVAETLDADVRRWSSGKEGNLRALLSTLQYILGSDSGWQPIPLTEVITAPAVKKAYRKATLCVHPDKLQQRGASIQQKYICEKVFDLLKEAWNKFNSEER